MTLHNTIHNSYVCPVFSALKCRKKKKNAEYDQEIQKSHIAEQPKVSRGSALEHEQSKEIWKTFTVKQPAGSFSSR